MGNGFGCHGANQNPAYQSRPACRGDRVYIGHGQPGLGKGCFNNLVNDIQMLAGSDFRHHPAKAGVNFSRRGDVMRQYLAIRAYQRCSGFITTAFDPQNDGLLPVHNLFFHPCYRVALSRL